MFQRPDRPFTRGFAQTFNNADVEPFYQTLRNSGQDVKETYKERRNEGIKYTEDQLARFDEMIEQVPEQDRRRVFEQTVAVRDRIAELNNQARLGKLNMNDPQVKMEVERELDKLKKASWTSKASRAQLQEVAQLVDKDPYLRDKTVVKGKLLEYINDPNTPLDKRDVSKVYKDLVSSEGNFNHRLYMNDILGEVAKAERTFVRPSGAGWTHYKASYYPSLHKYDEAKGEVADYLSDEVYKQLYNENLDPRWLSLVDGSVESRDKAMQTLEQKQNRTPEEQDTLEEWNSLSTEERRKDVISELISQQYQGGVTVDKLERRSYPPNIPQTVRTQQQYEQQIAERIEAIQTGDYETPFLSYRNNSNIQVLTDDIEDPDDEGNMAVRYKWKDPSKRGRNQWTTEEVWININDPNSVRSLFYALDGKVQYKAPDKPAAKPEKTEEPAAPKTKPSVVP